jgi:pyruvate dehydrogenase phosphatase
MLEPCFGTIMKAIPTGLRTPPYVTSRPEITHTQFIKTVAPDGQVVELRFLVLATDGLWDKLSSRDVASLVISHLDGVIGDVPKHSCRNGSFKQGFEGKAVHSNSAGKWIFKDKNIAQHLLRNAFHDPRGDEAYIRRTLSIPAPLARRYRDDASVTIVLFPSADDNILKVAR